MINFFRIFHLIQIYFGAPSYETITLPWKPMNFGWSSTHFFKDLTQYTTQKDEIWSNGAKFSENIYVFVGSLTFVIKYAICQNLKAAVTNAKTTINVSSFASRFSIGQNTVHRWRIFRSKCDSRTVAIENWNGTNFLLFYSC